MTESRSNTLSWADEVEKEEEEEAQAHLFRQTKTQKPNPFGSARPREDVLKERGIDWRVIDHGQGLLQLPFSDRIKKHCNGKPQREIISNPAPGGPTRNLEQVLPLVQPVLVSHCNQIPIRCPPRNGILKWIEKPCISPNIGRGSSNRFEPEKENMVHEHRLQRDHCVKSSNPRTHKGPCPNGKTEECGTKAKRGQEKSRRWSNVASIKDCPNGKTGECGTKAKQGQEKRRRWSNVAPIKDGTASSKELCYRRVQSSVPAGIELKKMKMSNEPQKTVEDFQSSHVVAGECGRARVGHRQKRRGTQQKQKNNLIGALN
ncbi:uncharacterized protein LOC133789567 [Humulus lupulus]|uniref:uncharacterized protein LOC133789567 n=1 Tax=Humulus lupulus TaxID=3486 RepID=UPI002B414070|nr:uncharacterized protein LOC133789567 [Humulus lupulus]